MHFTITWHSASEFLEEGGAGGSDPPTRKITRGYRFPEKYWYGPPPPPPREAIGPWYDHLSVKKVMTIKTLS